MVLEPKDRPTEQPQALQRQTHIYDTSSTITCTVSEKGSYGCKQINNMNKLQYEYG